MKLYSLSASKIKTYKDCAFKFYLNYHLGLDLGTSFAADQGSMVHVILQKFGEANKLGIEDPPVKSKWYDYILHAYREEGIWKLSEKALNRPKACDSCPYHLAQNNSCFVNNSAIESFKGCPKDEFEDAIWLVQRIINDETLQNPLNKKIIDVEERFEIDIMDGEEVIPIVGYMDVVAELDKETIEVVDYKTGKHTMSYNECLTDPQLLIYHLAARRGYRGYQNIFITINYLRKKPVTLAFGQKDEDGTENAIKKYWYKIKSDESPRRRCDRLDGSVHFDHVCKYLCNIELCKKHHKEFLNNGGVILPANEQEKNRRRWLEDIK
jgi:hypothetical protein